MIIYLSRLVALPITSFVALALAAVVPAQDQHEQHHKHHHNGHTMILDGDGMVMNFNSDILPKDCAAVAADLDIEVRVGREYARQGITFGYNIHEWKVLQC